MKNMENLYQHGGNIYEVKQRSVLDFSANINPLGIPPRVKKLLSKQLKDLIHYPDPEAHRLVAALVRYWKVKEENVLVGNGSTELIYLILNAFQPDKVILPAPSFAEYERAARISGSRIRFIYMLEGEGFCLNFSHVDNCDMLFMCNPNNPTGNLIVNNRADIKNIPVKRIVIDEAFMDFVPDEKRYTFILEAVRSKKIIVLRTLTKFFALPGLRVGYLIAHRDIIRFLKEYQIPWSVNVLAQEVAGAVLHDKQYIDKTRFLIEKEREFLFRGLSAINGLLPYPSVANFILVKIKDSLMSAAKLRQNLIHKGILIRDCANFRGLNNKYFRIAVRLRADNLRLLEVLEKYYRKGV